MTRGKLPPLTRAETEVMQIVWHKAKASVHDVVAALERPLAYTTALTVLRTLEKKGYLTHEADPEHPRAYLFCPTVAQHSVGREQVSDLVQRVFGGDIMQLALGLVENHPLSREQLQELREKIDAHLANEPANKKRKK